jgi:DNA-directed RNA polymerase specialized sigma24 family protein
MAAQGEKRTLTPEAFGTFLRWLSVDDELAVREYQEIRTKLIRFFIHKGCTDAADLFDKTVDIVVGKIAACAQYSNPLAYCYGVARNVWYQDTRERNTIVMDVDIAAPLEHPDPKVHEQELQCLERCLSQLSPGDRDIVIQYHAGQGRKKIQARRLLADGVGGTNALRIRMCRIRKQLRICVVACTKRLLN